MQLTDDKVGKNKLLAMWRNEVSIELAVESPRVQSFERNRCAARLSGTVVCFQNQAVDLNVACTFDLEVTKSFFSQTLCSFYDQCNLLPFFQLI